MQESNDLDMSKLDWTSQLLMLKDLTNRLGGLHEAQVLQLKLWPYCVDTTIKKNKISIDLENKLLLFEWKGSSATINNDYKTKLKSFVGSIKFMLGDDWSVTVHSDGTIIYPLDTNGSKSRKRKPVRNRSGNRRR
jgi:hypothetical protein